MHSVTSESLGLLIGSLSPSQEVALALFAPVTVLQVIFDGKNLAVANTPKALRWLQEVSLVRLAWQGLVINEFEGLDFEAKGRGPQIRDGEDAKAVFNVEGTVGER